MPLVWLIGCEGILIRGPGKCCGVIWIPFVSPFYRSIPAIHAQLSHFWHLDLLHIVRNKPMNNKAEA
jgi:hypothetical protein